jgi:hypothetical protein
LTAWSFLKAKAYKRGLMFSPEVSKKFELIGVDLYTGIPIKDGKAKTVAEAIFDHWITKYGPPQLLTINKPMANARDSIAPCLPTCVLEYNCSKHSVTQESPYFMVFGQEPRLP